MEITATITIDVPSHFIDACKIDPSNLAEFNTRNDARNATMHLLARELTRSLRYNSYNDVMALTHIRDYIIHHGDETLFTL